MDEFARAVALIATVGVIADNAAQHRLEGGRAMVRTDSRGTKMQKKPSCTKRALVMSGVLGLTLLYGCSTGGPSTAESPVSAAAALEVSRDVTKADVDQWITELSNWGRWGKDDRIGALNLIDSAARKRAAALVHDGVSVSMARSVETESAADNNNPFHHTMRSTGLTPGNWAGDEFCVEYHGYAHTHMDALCHIFHAGKNYNGFSRAEVTDSGATKLGIEHVKDGIFGRGVLIDVPRLRGKKYLDPGEAIWTEDIEAFEKETGLRIGPGDILLVRTGRWARRDERGPWSVGEEGAAGLHVSCVPWLKARDIAVLGSDAASDVLPSRVEGYSHPVHLLMLNTMGVHIFDNFDLERLAAECEKRGRWEFLLTAAPLAVPGATGSPLNPIATF